MIRFGNHVFFGVWFLSGSRQLSRIFALHVCIQDMAKKKGRAVNSAFSCSVEPSPIQSVESSEPVMIIRYVLATFVTHTRGRTIFVQPLILTVSSQNAVIFTWVHLITGYVWRWPAEKMHIHPRRHILNATSNSLFKYNLWRPMAITWFFVFGVEVGWQLII